MAEIDPSKRKPRRTAGTPSYYYRNRFALAIIAGGSAIFGLFYLTPLFQTANRKFLEHYSQPDIELQERKALMGFGLLPQKRGEDILKALNKLEEIKSETSD